MKTSKILFGSIIILVAIKEFFVVSKEFGVLITLIPILLIIGVGGIIIRNGIRTPKKLKPFFWTQRIPIFVLNGFLILTGVFIIFKPNPNTYTIDINGSTIPLDNCVYGSKSLIPNQNNRVEFCECLAEKIGNSTDLTETQLSHFHYGRLALILNELTEEQKIIIDMSACSEYLDGISHL